MKLLHKLTYFILASIIICAICNGVDNNWTELLANFVAFVGWFAVLGYQKEEHNYEAF